MLLWRPKQHYIINVTLALSVLDAKLANPLKLLVTRVHCVLYTVYSSKVCFCGVSGNKFGTQSTGTNELDILTVALAAVYCILHLAVAIVNVIICSTWCQYSSAHSDPQN